MMYRVERDWEVRGFRCVVIMTDAGHRCGYVGVDAGHPLYGVGYNDPVPTQVREMWEKVKEGTIGKRGILDVFFLDMDSPRVGILFDVHGGITYSGGTAPMDYPTLSLYPVVSELWWFGYDCAHAGDAPDLNEIPDEKLRDIYRRFPRGNEKVRSLEYCVKECESLVRQLLKVEEVG